MRDFETTSSANSKCRRGIAVDASTWVEVLDEDEFDMESESELPEVPCANCGQPIVMCMSTLCHDEVIVGGYVLRELSRDCFRILATRETWAAREDAFEVESLPSEVAAPEGVSLDSGLRSYALPRSMWK